MTDPNTPEAIARREARALQVQTREAQATEREREAAARVVAIDKKTARLKALRLAREAEKAAATAAAAPKSKKR